MVWSQSKVERELGAVSIGQDMKVEGDRENTDGSWLLPQQANKTALAKDTDSFYTINTDTLRPHLTKLPTTSAPPLAPCPPHYAAYSYAGLLSPSPAFPPPSLSRGACPEPSIPHSLPCLPPTRTPE